MPGAAPGYTRAPAITASTTCLPSVPTGVKAAAARTPTSTAGNDTFFPAHFPIGRATLAGVHFTRTPGRDGLARRCDAARDRRSRAPRARSTGTRLGRPGAPRTGQD